MVRAAGLADAGANRSGGLREPIVKVLQLTTGPLENAYRRAHFQKETQNEPNCPHCAQPSRSSMAKMHFPEATAGLENEPNCPHCAQPSQSASGEPRRARPWGSKTNPRATHPVIWSEFSQNFAPLSTHRSEWSSGRSTVTVGNPPRDTIERVLGSLQQEGNETGERGAERERNQYWRSEN